VAEHATHAEARRRLPNHLGFMLASASRLSYDVYQSTENNSDGPALQKRQGESRALYAANCARVRLNCIAHMLSMVPYEDAVPPPLNLSPRRPHDDSYVSPPKSDQNIIPDVKL
jgi:hypothetical protein